ncbi:hypothetical protein [Bacillus mesophilum]|uniref:Uncharacterized protein n=1 Tax=Bacillus mesophilum TaxID=1071718 RepID=A0A7V7UWS4_9BACI|nr:hypothetical protein [Bacillus mesophilum]KAB2335065.1 hypothetical protein F7732_00375 [Bacillus mesophilum]
MISESNIIDEVLPLLDIITILIIEDDPIIGIVLVTLLKLVTEDRIARISLILLVIVLGIINFEY